MAFVASCRCVRVCKSCVRVASGLVSRVLKSAKMRAYSVLRVVGCEGARRLPGPFPFAASACPGHPAYVGTCVPDRDGRDKPGHDRLHTGARHRPCFLRRGDAVVSLPSLGESPRETERRAAQRRITASLRMRKRVPHSCLRELRKLERASRAPSGAPCRGFLVQHPGPLFSFRALKLRWQTGGEAAAPLKGMGRGRFSRCGRRHAAVFRQRRHSRRVVVPAGEARHGPGAAGANRRAREAARPGLFSGPDPSDEEGPGACCGKPAQAGARSAEGCSA